MHTSLSASSLAVQGSSPGSEPAPSGRLQLRPRSCLGGDCPIREAPGCSTGSPLLAFAAPGLTAFYMCFCELAVFKSGAVFKALTIVSLPPLQFLAQLKLMDYSLLVGIHDVERAEQEEVECEEDGEEEGESDGAHPVGTPPDSPGNTLNSSPPLAPGEFDPNIDVYGIKCHESKWRYHLLFFYHWFDFFFFFLHC